MAKAMKAKAVVATLKVGDRVYTAAGKDVYEAVDNLPLPIKLTYQGHLRVTKNGNYAEYLIPVPQLRRLFSNKTTRLQVAKWAAYRLQ